MGNREKLLDAAVGCLYEKGYARTTARDVASAAGVSLAAIGYHFGSTEALLGAALHRAVGEWGEALERALRGDGAVGAEPADPADPATRFAAIWDRIVESVRTQRSLWSVQLEVVTQLDRLPDQRALFTGSQEAARTGLADLFGGASPGSEPRSELESDPVEAAVVGGFYQALLTGVVVQHLIDPEHAPTGRDLAQALQMAAARLTPRAEAPGHAVGS